MKDNHRNNLYVIRLIHLFLTLSGVSAFVDRNGFWSFKFLSNNIHTSDDEQDEYLGSRSPSFSSSSSSDLTEDAASSPSGNIDPLSRMSDLLEELPIRKGLSKHFQGKSQSFRSLANVRCLEDFAKKIRVMPSYRRKIKPFDHHHHIHIRNPGGCRRDQTIKSISSTKGRSSRIISKNHFSMGKNNHQNRNINEGLTTTTADAVSPQTPSCQPLFA
ncbi:hypothetical protein ZOSMA_8G00800 [Zostera marina]|uniref:Uncharacterized protein n=1 Tax=Zostera marina TaxID=29655 RepID=A0A0K9NLS4_ZOSMR|nr:hypothetical protein ZOSMA_8G00800 [Zostera marina]